jgi:hypothetical protein
LTRPRHGTIFTLKDRWPFHAEETMTHGFGRVAAVAMVGLAVAVAPVSADIVGDNVSSLGEEFARGYLEPISDGMNASMNSGIFRTGDIPIAGLNVSLDFTTAIISFSDESRTWTPEVPAGFESGEVPTVIGGTESESLLGPGGAQLAFPGGVDLNHWGYVAPQITVGSVLGTRAMVRWLSFTIGDEDIGDVKLWGIGGQHSISQYFPGLPFQAAVGAMWQTVELGGGKLIDADGLALNLTGSRRFGKVISVEPYVGVGLDSFKMDANYELTDSSGNVLEEVNVSYDRKNTGRLTLGAGVNMPIVSAFGELNFAAENGFAFGLSFGF